MLSDASPFGVLAGILGVLAVFAGTWVTARSATKSARITSDGPNWKGFTDNVVTRLQRVEDENDELRDRVVAIEREMVNVSRLLVLALSYIERLLDWIAEHNPDDAEVPPVPRDLHEKLSPSVTEDRRRWPRGTRADRKNPP